ncbi:MAG: protease inhibitor I42 family protein [Actinomycetota bacterium]|nr:protease inhibitor I42 family protein [Actinomycetota bacterium]
MYKSKIIKKMVLISLVTAIFILFFNGCSTTGKALTEKNNGDSLNLKINDTIEIRLESNPTTGYGWFLSDKADSTIVSVTDPEFIEPKKDKELIGAGGYEIFTIKAISKGKTSIILNYERPWEEGVEPIETFEITISVD